MEGSYSLIRRAAGKLMALPPAFLLAALLWRYPFQPLLAAVLCALYCAVLWWRPQLWLMLVPAALPWLDLSPWSGRFYLDELDLMLLATLAVGYWRLADTPPDSRLPRSAVVLLALVAASTALAAWHGLLPLTSPDLNSYANYLSPYNSLRIAKGTLWALLLLPLLRRAGGRNGIAAQLVPGMLLGLLLTGLAVMWERTLFPGLLNFSSDYRPTAPFAAMHTGGAALDAYLAMAFPFAAWWLLYPARRWQTAAALGLLLLGLFTGFTLFSRDIWLAYGAAAVVLVVLHAGPRLASGRLRFSSVAGLAALLLLLCATLGVAFFSGGYRALASLLVLWGATLVLGGLPRERAQPGLSIAVALLLALAAAAAIALLRSSGLPGWFKGPYFAYLMCAGVGAVACALAAFGPQPGRRAAHAVALGAYAPLALCAVMVAWHWGGGAAAGAAAVAALPAVVLLLVALLRPQPLWQLDRASLSLGGTGAALLAAAIPILASSYMGERMSTVERDWQLRLHHWREAVQIMPDRWEVYMLGVGLGRYPATYYWHNLLGEQPGGYRYETETDGNRYLRLVPPQHPRGYADPLRHLQLVRPAPYTNYVLEFDARRQVGDTKLSLALCRRWLLYPQDCVPLMAPNALARNSWQHYQLQLNSGRLGAGKPGPVQLELAAYGEDGAIDLDNISLRGPDGTELIRNGDFTHGQDGWFFSSDRDHLPWHIKNFFVHTYFEQGWLGCAVMGLLLLYTVGRLASHAWDGKPGSAIYLAALTGALVVGGFDSLFDVPRLTLLFFLLMSAGLLRQRRQRSARL